MLTVNWDYWLEEVAQTIAGADRDLVRYHVRAAAIEFCQLSEAWHLEALPLDIEQGQNLYTLQAPLSDVDIVGIVFASIQDKFITPKSKADIERQYGNALTQTGPVRHYYQQSANQLMLFPTPDFALANGLKYTVAVRPTRSSNGMNADLGKEYFDAIANGAIARLYKLPNRPWSDGAAFTMFEQRMKESARRAKSRAFRGLGRGARNTGLFLIGGR